MSSVSSAIATVEVVWLTINSVAYSKPRVSRIHVFCEYLDIYNYVAVTWNLTVNYNYINSLCYYKLSKHFKAFTDVKTSISQ